MGAALQVMAEREGWVYLEHRGSRLQFGGSHAAARACDCPSRCAKFWINVIGGHGNLDHASRCVRCCAMPVGCHMSNTGNLSTQVCMANERKPL
jgi:hypothetical protein